MSRILIVDADKISLVVTHRILSEDGFEVDQARTFNEGRQYLVQNEYSLVITDTNLDESRGAQIIATFKQIRPQIEVMVITGYGTLDTAVECMRAGAIDFLLKPCKRQQLCDAVRKAIEKSELSLENTLLRKLNAMKDKFLTLVSHEMRTPLTLLNGYLRVLRFQGLPPEQREILDTTIRACQQLIDIVNNIQTITQAESGEMRLHLQTILVGKMLSDIVVETHSSVTERKLRIGLQSEAACAGLQILGDPIRLRQVIGELLQNAIRNTEDGGEITISASLAEPFVVIGVRDTGIGIPLEEQGKIFDRFYEVADERLHSSGTFKFGGGGIGLGLPLVRSVVEAHHGSVKLESEPGHGTYVEIRLPSTVEPFSDELVGKVD